MDKRIKGDNSGFSCESCGRWVEPVIYGGKFRNHCPYCLSSKHVDNNVGDRKNSCGGMMKAEGFFKKGTGEYVLVHRCERCDEVRYNRIAGDDDFEKVKKLREVIKDEI